MMMGKRIKMVMRSIGVNKNRWSSTLLFLLVSIWLQVFVHVEQHRFLFDNEIEIETLSSISHESSTLF